MLLVVTGCGKKYMNLRGQVIDHQTGESLANIEVQVGSKTVTTNDKGYFQIKEIPVVDDVAKKERMIKVDAAGYKDYSQAIALKEGDKSVKVELERAYMSLSGQVIDRFENSPLSGVKVEVGNRIVETDANGYFALEDIPVLAEEKIVKVAAPAYRTYAEVIEIKAGSKDLTIKLEGRQETKFFFSSDQRGAKDIYRTDIYGEQLKRLTANQADDWAPDWSASRGKVLFLSKRNGHTNIYSMNEDGSQVQQLTQTTTEKENPVWLDEDRILYASNRDGDYDLYITDVDGSYLQRLTDNNHYDGQAAYSDQQNAIAYIAATTGHKKLHLMDLETETKLLLSKSAGVDRTPRWSATGDKILFANFHAGQSTVNQINYNGSGLKELFAVDEEIVDYALWDLKSRLLLYVSQNESKNIKLLTPNGAQREVLVKEDINEADPAWQE